MISAFAQQEELIFPEDYLGGYKGDLKIQSPRGSQEIGMEFHLLEILKRRSINTLWCIFLMENVKSVSIL